MGLTSITNIPTIMRSKGWHNGARLMERWFAGPPVAKPAHVLPDSTTIKMSSWVLRFPRAGAVFNSMVQEQVWKSEKARPLFANRLRSAGLLTASRISFDFSTRDSQAQHALHVNFRKVGSGYTTALDDMVAALGNFSIYVTPIQGVVSSENGKHRVSLAKVGFHLFDSYDFEGDQDLGYWDERTNRVSTTFMYSGTRVGNDNFREWRTKNQRGGDFLIFSDVKVVSLNPPDSFLI